MKFNDRNIQIGENVVIGSNVRIGDNTTIYDNVQIGDDSIICDNCVVGEPTNEYYHSSAYENPVTTVGSSSLIRSHTIIYAGSRIGSGFSCGHRVTIRENSILGDHCRIGTLSDLQGNIVIGQSVWLHSNVHVCSGSSIEDFVFIYPYTVLTNDPHPPSTSLKAPVIQSFAQLGVGTIVLPGIVIGRHALTGAGSVITRNVLDYSLVTGNPARHVKDVREILSAENGQSLYPWPHRFDRGMPWKDIPFKEWLSQQTEGDKHRD